MKHPLKLDQADGDIPQSVVGRWVRKTEGWVLGSRFPGGFGLGLVVALGLGGVAWFALRHQAVRGSGNELPSLDYFLRTSSPPSFSEAKNARNLLKADCLRSLSALQIEWRAIWAKRIRSRTGPTPAQRVISDPHRLREFVGTIRKKIRDYDAVEEQCDLYRELFLTLQAAGLHNLWLDTYLRLLYERPTLPLLARYAKTAVEFAAKTHRTAELRHAFDLVTRIPLDFAGKPAIAALAQEIKTDQQAGAPPTHLPPEIINAER